MTSRHLRQRPSRPGADGLPRARHDEDRVRGEVVAALAGDPKTLPCRFFYDQRGAELFDRITRLEAYYLTAAEMEVLRERAEEIARLVGPRARLVEYGSGSGEKTWLLLDRLERPAAYVPVDVSRRQLAAFAERVRRRYPTLEVTPVAADYTRLERLPTPPARVGATLAFFPGSTIGNLEPEEAVAFLRTVVAQAGPDSFLLVGADLVKDEGALERAYDDPEGVTAEFNRNMLVHLNRLIGSAFDPAAFGHRAVWNAEAERVEMHLVSRRAQEVALGPAPEHPRVRLRKGEPIVTEHSHKYRVDGFLELANRAGYRSIRVWTDAGRRFSVHLLQPSER